MIIRIFSKRLDSFVKFDDLSVFADKALALKLVSIDALEVLPATHFAEDYEISAFSGLRDKFGNRIFEKDLLAFSDPEATVYEVKFVRGSFVVEHYSSEPSFSPQYLGLGKTLGGHNEVWLADWEVVGNIYQD